MHVGVVGFRHPLYGVCVDAHAGCHSARSVDVEALSLGVRLSIGPPCVLVFVLELLCDGLRLPRLSLRTMGLRVRAVPSCSTDLLASGAARAFRGVRGVGSLATDSLRCAPSVADYTFALYSAAMRSDIGATHATRCCL